MEREWNLQALRAIRETRSLPLRTTAERAAIDPGQLSRIETGQALPSIETLLRLADTLGIVELACLLTYKDAS